MELDDNTKRAVRELGDAINSAVGNSERVAWAIESLRELGYEADLSLKLEIGLFEIEDKEDSVETGADVSLELTEDDLRTLRGMKISLE